MKNNTEIKYCQTCGIPLNIDYASLTGGRNEEYCDYCLKNGVKLYDFSMDYLIYLWGLFPEEYYREVGISYTSSELREIMSKRLPKIKDGSKNQYSPCAVRINYESSGIHKLPFV